jgi:hypothetical protein
VSAGVPVEGRLAHPLLRFPSAEQIFTELAAARRATAQRSDAGRRAANAVGLWGSFDAIVADLSGPARRLLDAFLPPARKRDGDYRRGYAIRGDGYLTFTHAAALDTDTGTTRKTLDRLLGLNVLRRGLLLSCERCRWQAFYPIEQVGPSFRCAACSHASPVTQGRWYKGDPGPAWNYSLDQVVRDLLRQHGDLPLLAAAHLRRNTRAFLWAPELIIAHTTGTVELDICVIVHGHVVVGEAKSNGRLESSDKGTGRAATRLIQAAQLLNADEIVLATSEPAWAPGAITAVQTALAAGWRTGPTPTPHHPGRGRLVAALLHQRRAPRKGKIIAVLRLGRQDPCRVLVNGEVRRRVHAAREHAAREAVRLAVHSRSRTEYKSESRHAPLVKTWSRMRPSHLMPSRSAIRIDAALSGSMAALIRCRPSWRNPKINESPYPSLPAFTPSSASLAKPTTLSSAGRVTAR